MNETTRHSILTLPHSSTELQSKNRNKSGYTTFVSAFITEFNELSFNEKKDQLLKNNIHSSDGYDQHERAPRIFDAPVATAMDKNRLAAKSWRQLDDDLKKGWRERAELVNKLPILGEMQALPSQVTEKEVLASINMELFKFVTLMHNSLRRGSRIIDSVKTKAFGNERVIVRSKIFRSLFLNHLLKLTFFGINFSLVKEDEIVWRRKKTTVIHIHSKDRMVELFERGSVCSFVANDRRDTWRFYGCAGRFILRNRISRKEVIGFVMEEKNDGLLVVQLETNVIIEMMKPRYLEECRGQWEYRDTEEYTVEEYDPIRIKVQERGNTQFLFHVFTYRKNISASDRIEITPF